MPYERPWYSQNPGCLIVLIDQSGSMDEPIRGDSAGRHKCDIAATIVNNTLSRLANDNTTNAGVKARAEVAIIGYGSNGVGSAFGGALSNRDFVTLPELKMQPLRVETRMKYETDETGEKIGTPVEFPIWVEAQANGGTPLGEALRAATHLAHTWAANHIDSHPPLVINITDGAATDCGPSRDFTQYARALTDISTADGSVLLLNCHISSTSVISLQYPADESLLSNADPLAQMLFQTASVLPDNIRARMAARGVVAEPAAKGFIYNGDAVSLSDMFVFATPTSAEFRSDR